MPSNQDTQIASFLSRDGISNIQPDSTGGESPRVIFESALKLTRQQEDNLVSYILDKRKGELEQELGRVEVSGDLWWNSTVWNNEANPLKFLPRRALWDMVYQQRMEWRKNALGGIFAQGQNVHMPMSFRIIHQMIARAQNYFFSTDPYFSVNPMPAPGVDTSKATQCDAFAKFKFEQNKGHGVKSALEKAVETAFIRGECVMKTRHWTDAIRYETIANVAVESLGGPPLVAHDGDYIYDTDRWQMRQIIPLEVQQQLDAYTTAGIDPLSQGIDTSIFPQAMTLERDPATSMPVPLLFEKRPIQRKVTRYSGPEAAQVSMRDFLAPLNADSLQTADIMMHFYDIPAIQLVEMYIERLKAMDQYDPREFPRVLELLRTAPSAISPNTFADRPRPDLHETTSSIPSVKSDPALSVVEAYVRFDANNDGQYEEIFIMIDTTTKIPIIYDHLPNVFPNARRPFTVMRINPIDGRWHGLGMVEIFWELQNFLDLNMNRWDMSNSQNGSVTFWHPEKTVEGAANPALKLNCGQTYRKRDPKDKAEDIVERIWLHEYKADDLQSIIQFVTQMMTVMSGVSNVNDGQMAGLDSQKLATGVRNIDQSGQEQFAPFISQLRPGIEEILESLLYLALWHMDEVEVVHVLKSDPMVPGSLPQMTPLPIQAIDIQNLKYEVSLELSRYKNEQAVAQAQAARECLTQWYSTPPNIQAASISLYRQELRGYGVQDVDEMLKVGLFMPPMGPDGAPMMPPEGDGEDDEPPASAAVPNFSPQTPQGPRPQMPPQEASLTE